MKDFPGLYLSIEGTRQSRSRREILSKLTVLYHNEGYKTVRVQSPFQYNEIYLLDPKVQYARLLACWLDQILPALQEKAIVFCDDSLWTLVIKAIQAVDNPEVTEDLLTYFIRNINPIRVNTPDLVFYLEDPYYTLEDMYELGYSGDGAVAALAYFAKVQHHYMTTNPGIITEEVYRIPKEITSAEPPLLLNRIKNVLDLVIDKYDIART